MAWWVLQTGYKGQKQAKHRIALVESILAFQCFVMLSFQ